MAVEEEDDFLVRRGEGIRHAVQPPTAKVGQSLFLLGTDRPHDFLVFLGLCFWVHQLEPIPLRSHFVAQGGEKNRWRRLDFGCRRRVE